MPAPSSPDARAGTDARCARAGEPGYPAGLRDLPDAPGIVFIAGAEIPPVTGAVAIVGSRAASRYGVAQAQRLAGDMARLGFVVVSGLARGIDAAAHRGALAAGGCTVAVLPSGLDCVTPRHHRQLAAEIAERGALLTEWEHGEPRGKATFIQRNRLIAALASATVVVEAAERSGALSTAAAARRLGRPVLAYPGDVDRETSKGCNALIKKGAARMCESAADVLALLSPGGGGAGVPRGVGRERSSGAPRSSERRGVHAPERSDGAPRRVGTPAPPPPALAPQSATPETAIVSAMDHEPQTVDAIAKAAGLTIAETLAALLALQWAGVAEPRPGQRWARSRK